ncbi:MAG: IspD/TarI family cytidylyltransferase [Phycisphaerales bacterium]
MNVAVIIPAAGASQRYIAAAKAEQGLEAGRSKLEEEIGGRPLLHRTVEVFTKVDVVRTIVVAGPHDAEAMAEFRRRHADKLGLLGVRLCEGGKTHRYETVRNALALVPAEATHVAVHDAARPCITVEFVERMLAVAARHGAVIPALPVADTLKRGSDGPLAAEHADPLAAILGTEATAGPTLHGVKETVDRRGLFAVQTPQIFRADVLRRAYAQKDLASTDDAQLVERLGEPVVMVPGDARNIKVTLPTDLLVARAILGARPAADRSPLSRF